MATFQEFGTAWKTAIDLVIQKNFSDFLDQAGADATAFVNEARDDLIKWTALFAAGAIDKDELTALIQSDRDLLELHALKQAGLAQARWDLFVNTVIQTTVSVAIKVFV